MADPEDIKFKLQTEGDTSGAEAVEKSIFKAEDAAKQASRQADVDLVKQRQAIAAQKEQAAVLREIADGQQRVVAANLAGALGKIAGEFQGISQEADLALTGTQNFLNVFASTGNPITAALALVGTAVNGVMDAYREAEKTVKASDEATAARLRKIADLRAEYARNVREEGLEAFFKRQLDALTETEQALIRIAQIRASERDLAAARTEASGAAAVDAGKTTAEGAQALALSQEVTNQVTAIQDELALAATAQQKIQDEATALKQEAALLIENSDKQKQVLASANAKQQEADKALLDLNAAQEVGLNKIETLKTRGVASVEEISQASLTALTAATQKSRDAIKAEVDRLGTNASAGAKSTLALLDSILKDGIVRADEQAKLAEAQGRMNGMTEKANAQVLAALEDLAKNQTAFLSVITPVTQRIRNMEAEISRLSAQMSAIPTP
jgi:hypothetical protein